MKNGKIKLNKTKIIARVMLVVLLVVSILTLTACPGNNQRNYSTFYYSYDEMIEFANNHKEAFESDDCVFFVFNINEYPNITLDYYYVGTKWFVDGWDYYKSVEKLEMPTDHFLFDISCKFKMNAISEDGKVTKDAYIIYCRDYHLDDYEISENNLSVIRSRINIIDSIESISYVSEYFIYVEENIGMNISISHKHEATQEELDLIVQVFLDNMMVIK